VATGQSTQPAARIGSAVAWILERREGSVIVGLITLYLAGVIIAPGRFLTFRKMMVILRDSAPIAIMGFGVAMLMITAEFDLSVGSMLGLSGGLVLVMTDQIGLNDPFAVVAILVFGVLYGVTQGLIVTQLNLPSLIVTIGTLTGIRGALQIATGTQGLSVQDVGMLSYFGAPVVIGDISGIEQLPFFTSQGLEYKLPFVHDSVQTFNNISLQIFWMFVLLVVFHYVLFYTRFGYHVRATGDNIESAGTTGIDPDMVKIACFAIVGMTAAFAGLAFVGRTGAISPTTGSGTELFAIAAVVLGGTKLTGGEGSMIGVVLGSVVLEVANQVLVTLGLGVSGWQSVITGAFIVAAVGLDVLFRGVSVDLLRRWYTDPTRQLISSPSSFFRTEAIQRTSSELYGYLFVSMGVTAVLTNVVAWLIGLEVESFEILGAEIPGLSVPAALLGGDLPKFKLFFEGNQVETVMQVYLFLLFVTILSFLVIEFVTQRFDRTGDYESSLGIACYSSVVAPVLSIPFATYGFDVFFVVSPLVSSLIIAVPVFAAMLWLMRVGVAELHGVSRSGALATIGAVAAVWLVVAGITGWSLMAA